MSNGCITVFPRVKTCISNGGVVRLLEKGIAFGAKMKEFKLEMQFAGDLHRPQQEILVLVVPWDITGMQSNGYFTLFDIAPRKSFEMKETNLSFPLQLQTTNSSAGA